MAEFGKIPPETSQAIDRAARAWAVKLDRGPLSDAERAELDAWLAGSSRRAGALARAEAMMAWTEPARALAPHYSPEDFGAETRPTRRRLLAWGGGMAAAAATVAGFKLWPQSQLYQTQKGEIRLIPLEGGSTVTLNTDSKAKVSDTSAGHRVELLSGEAFFQVAKSAARPFMVAAAGALVQARGAAFAVSNLAGTPLCLIVRQGLVELSRSVNARTLKVGADEEALVPRDPSAAIVLEAVGSDHVKDAFAWLEGKIVLQGETLFDAARQFFRYSDMRIVIEDPALAKEQVAGLFTANDPIGFCSAITSALGAKMRIEGKTILLSR
jgi:transmembrane sensor